MIIVVEGNTWNIQVVGEAPHRYIEHDDAIPVEEKCPILLNLSAVHLSLGDHVAALDYANRVVDMQVRITVTLFGYFAMPVFIEHAYAEQ